ncbi:glycosyltransferase family 4 protein [Polycladidibacter stylochi]|uniref:glycosyltransferase family 4 protein n=1 Tax=Polycladidibacter stylochi TaxID=1807766 RepID=UPI000B293FD0|nr:glycosyltransferase family 4 protein [Pseudovibrio stylochi]
MSYSVSQSDTMNSNDPWAGTKPDEQTQTIMQVIPDLQTGGAERTTLDVAEAIIAKGWRSLVVSQGGRMVAELCQMGATHVELPVKSKKPWVIYQNIARLQKLVERYNVQLIHARSRAPAWSAYYAAKRCQLPFVTTYHGIYKETNWFKARYNSVMTKADCAIANSKYTQSLMWQRNPSCQNRTTVIYRGSDLQAFQESAVSEERRQKLRTAWGLSGGEHIVLTIARITGWKGHKTIIQAAKLLKERGLNQLTFVFAGDTQGREEYKAELEQLIAANGLTGAVKLVGHCHDVPAALSLAEYSVVASTEPEAFGRAAVEAQAAGVPVIVSNIGAVPETVLVPPVVTDSLRTGWHFEAGNAEDLAQKLALVNALPTIERQGLVKRAREHVTGAFSKQQMCDKTIAVYEELLTPK